MDINHDSSYTYIRRTNIHNTRSDVLPSSVTQYFCDMSVVRITLWQKWKITCSFGFFLSSAKVHLQLGGNQTVFTGETSLTVRKFLKIRQHFWNKNPFSDYLQGQQKTARLIPHVPFSDGRPDHANRSGDGWSFSDRQTRHAGSGWDENLENLAIRQYVFQEIHKWSYTEWNSLWKDRL